MKPSLATGLTAEERLRIDESRVIGFMGDDYRVYSTPSVLRDIEIACRKLAETHLDEGENTVGSVVHLEHLGAGLIGAEVTVRVEVVGVEGRRITFRGETRCGDDLIARCTHERFVVQLAKSKERLVKNTESAHARGAFGSPTFFVDDEIWFGKDRLREVEEAIVARRA